MAKITDSQRFGPTTDADVRDFEAQVGRLPADYRAFLLEHNGGRPEPEVFTISDVEGCSSVDWLLCLVDDPYWASLPQHQAMFEGRVPPELLVFGSDPGGNQIALGLTAEHAGVWFWDHENEEMDEDQPPTWDNLTRVAPSFDAFLDRLFEQDSDDPPDPPFDAAHAGDVGTLAGLLDAGTPVELANKFGRTLATEAAMHGQLETVRMLIDRGAYADAPFDLAARNGHVDVVQFLREQGLQLPKDELDGRLRGAAASGHTTIVRILLEMGADPNAPDAYGQSASTWAARCGLTTAGIRDLLRVLYDAGANRETVPYVLEIFDEFDRSQRA